MKRSILIISIALLAMQAYAQHDEQVTVEGKYRPKVNKVDKLKLNPEMPAPTYIMPSTEVNPKEARQKFAIDLEKIAPTAFASKEDKSVTPTKNFLMAGMGTRLSPIFLYKHNSMLTKTLGLGIGIKHNSSWLNIKDYAPSSYMNNAFDINLTTSVFEGLQVDFGAYYKNDMYHYYGVNLVETPLTDAQIEEYCPRQAYNSIGAHFGLASTSVRLGEWSHSGSVDYRYAFDLFGAKEHFVDLDYDLVYTQNWWGDKSHPQKLGVDLDFQYDSFVPEPMMTTQEGGDTTNPNRIFFKVNPFFEMSGEFYRLRLGVRLDGATEIAEDDKLLAVRPDLSGSLFVLNKKLEFYAGLNGGRKMLKFSEIVDENPFFRTAFYPNMSYCGLWFQNDKLDFQGGVRTNIAEIVDLHLGVRYGVVENLPYYMLIPEVIDNGSTIANKYGLGYYGDDSQVVNVLADVRVKLRNGLTADLGFAYNHYDLNLMIEDAHAWYRPTMEGKLKLTYDLNDNLSFHSSFLYQGERYASAPKSEFNPQLPGWYLEEKKMKDVLDLSLGADYKVNDQITAFALFDNVLCQKYQLYYNYPVTGLQFFAGVKLRF